MHYLCGIEVIWRMPFSINNTFANDGNAHGKRQKAPCRRSHVAPLSTRIFAILVAFTLVMPPIGFPSVAAAEEPDTAQQTQNQPQAQTPEEPATDAPADTEEAPAQEGTPEDNPTPETTVEEEPSADAPAETEEQPAEDAAQEQTTTEEATSSESDSETAKNSMPAQEFTEELKDDEGNVTLSVTVKAPKGAFPAGTTMHVREIDENDVWDQVESAVDGNIMRMAAVDISFLDKAGNEVEPQKKVTVKITSDLVSDIENPVLVHVIDEEKAKSDAEAEVVHNVTVMSNDEKGAGVEDTLKFKTEEFSPYVIVELETITTQVITASGETFTVSVTFGPEAGIPENATLEASEIEEGTEAYEELLDQTIRELSDADGIANIEHARFFDISIFDGDTEVEPLAPVQVRMDYNVPAAVSEEADLQVIHYAADGTEILAATPYEDESIVVEEGSSTISAIEFDTSSFSTFAFVASDYVGSLDGQSFAIVRDSGSNKAAVLSEPHPTVANRLAGTWVNDTLESGKLTPVTKSNGTTEADVNITAWTFAHVRDNVYYVQSDDGLYLSIDGTKLTAGTTPCPIEVVLLDKNGMYTGKVRLRSADDPSYYMNLKGGNAANGFQGSTSTDYNSTFSLYAAEGLDVYPTTTARKMSATEIQPGQYLVIYQRIYNEAMDKYEYYAIDGEGKLVYAFDEGDTIAYRNKEPQSTQWYVIEHIDEATGQPNGYYDFQNAKTGAYLAPQHASILSNEKIGVRLNGKDAGDANSTIEGWDASSWAYYGYQLDLENRVIVPGTGSDSTEFSFALPEEIDEGRLHEVATVDQTGTGITIGMYDFGTRKGMNLFGDDTWYQNGAFKQGLLQPTLGSDGMPVTKTGRSFSEIYNEANFKGNANHLFLQSIYDNTGYYAYSSFDNFAAYDTETGDFTVYDEQGTPSNGAGGSKTSFYRGNYYPYNSIDVNRPATNTKLYDSQSDWTSLENPAFNSKLYLTDTPNYFFGTVMEADFLQTKGGLDDDGTPIVYHFDGDDDLWVFIDGVLVLDIGGIHSAVPGSIDFSTGEVVAGEGSNTKTTTIRQAFKNAGVFPDGTAWNDALADEYFNGDTFSDYSGHTMKMFFQERGAGASSLNLRFNLPVIESGTFSVEKKLKGTEQQQYANVQFAYQAFLDFEGEDDVPIYPGIILGADGQNVDESSATPDQIDNRVGVRYENTGSTVDFYDNTPIGDSTYDHVFYLKPGESIVFSGIPKDVPYYVREIDVNGSYYDTVMVNEADMGGEGGIPEDTSITAQSSSKTIQQRQRVLFENECSPANMKDLRISKLVDNPQNDDATFEFRVFLEASDGTLAYYNQGNYYIVKQVGAAEHYFVFENGTLVDKGTEPVVCSKSGAYGTIAGIPSGYTVVIKGLLSGTDFKVEEINNPTGYLQVGKTLEEGTYQDGDVEGSDGAIKLREDAEMTITNHRYSTITVEKAWADAEDVMAHGEIAVALYKKGPGDSETLVEGNVLQGDAVQIITWPEHAATWYLDLGLMDSLANYVVREVKVTGEGSAQTVTPIANGGTITVTGETMAGSTGDEETQTADNSYGVTYSQGEPQKTGSIADRADVVTNTLGAPAVELPESGGPGTGLYILAGTLLVVACGGILATRRLLRARR